MSAALAGDAAAAAAVVLAHGAGNDMDSGFMRVFHAGLADRGFLAVRFNFPYKEAGRKLPDPRPLLETCFRAVADFVRGGAAPGGLGRSGQQKIVLGGKSMGGRIASHLVASGYAADALLFLAYPLHPPGKPEQKRDAHLYGIGCPMLFLSGTRDAFSKPELLTPVVERIGPGVTLAWIEGGDHSYRVRGRPQKEVYTEALVTVTGWLNRIAECGMRSVPDP